MDDLLKSAKANKIADKLQSDLINHGFYNHLHASGVRANILDAISRELRESVIRVMKNEIINN